jgi:hypothetical protein
MPGIIIQSKWSDTHGVRYNMDIYDTEFDGSVAPEPFDIVYGSIVVADEGNDSDPFKRVVPKSLTWTMLLMSSNYSAGTTTAVRSFYDDLSNSYEGRFYCRVNKVEADDYSDIIFMGKILPDVGDLTLTMHEELKLTAICGLKDLFNKEYKGEIIDGRYNDQPISFIEHFTKILSLNDVVLFFNNYYGAANPVFSTSQHWTNNMHNDTRDIFQFALRRHNYYEQISPTFRRFKNAGEVLTDLLAGFNARIYQANGVYQIEQLSFQDNDSVTRRSYRLDGFPLTGATALPIKRRWLMLNPNPIQLLTYPVVKRLPPFKAVRLKQNKGYYDVWNGLSIKWPGDAGPKNLGPQLAEGQQMAVELRLDIVPTIPGNRYLMNSIRITFEVKLGDNWLSPLDNDLEPVTEIIRTPSQAIDNIVQPVQFSWSPTAVQFELFIPWVFIPTDVRELRKLRFWWITDEVPDNGDLVWTIVDVTGNLRDDKANINSSIASIEILPESRIHMSEQGLDAFSIVPDQVTLVEVNDIRNTLVYDTDLSYYDYGGPIIRPDGTSGVSMDIIYYDVEDLSLPYNIKFIPLHWWKDPDMDVELPIQQLFMRSLLTMRSVPNKVVNVTMIHTTGQVLHSDDIFAWQPDIHLPVKYSHNMSTGEYTFALWKLTKDYRPVILEEDIAISEPFIPPGTILDTERAPDGGGITHFEEFFDVENPYVGPDYPLNLLDTEDEDLIRKNFTLIINGVKQRYVLQTVSKLSPDNGEWMIDTGDWTILFFKGRNPVKWIEFIAYM